MNKAIADIRLHPRCTIPPPFAADIRLAQCLQSSVCPYRVHAAAWTSPIRNSEAVRKCRFPLGNRHPHVTRVPRAKPTHYPTRHLDRFSRVCMGPKCYAVQCIVSGEENPQNCPFPLGFRHPAGGGPSHGHRQHAKEIGKDRACGSGDILADKQSDKQTDRQTCSSQYFATARAGEVSNTILHQPITSITTIICTTL